MSRASASQRQRRLASLRLPLGAMANYLITADPVASFQPRFDTTLRVMAELLARGLAVDYCDLLATDPSLPSERYLAALPVQRVLNADPARVPCVELGPVRPAAAGAYEVLLHRKDPPVDARYRAYAGHFARLPPETLQINAPAEVLRHSEHLLAADFPAYAVPTTHCLDLATLVAAVRAQPREAVAKPIADCSGHGIAFFAPDVGLPELQVYWDRYAGTGEDPLERGVVVQPYQEAILDRGDLRILVMNRRILGSVARVPRPGSRLANLHQGASVRAFDPTPRQLEAVAAVAERLTPRGLYLLGLDFIGDLLSELNFTSPSAMVQINEVMHKRAEVELVDEIEHLRRGGGSGPRAPARRPAYPSIM
jgi:glutathione synthase